MSFDIAPEIREQEALSAGGSQHQRVSPDGDRLAVLASNAI